MREGEQRRKGREIDEGECEGGGAEKEREGGGGAEGEDNQWRRGKRKRENVGH